MRLACIKIESRQNRRKLFAFRPDVVTPLILATPVETLGFDADDWSGAGTATLAVLEGDVLEHVECALGRRVGLRRTGVGLREAVGTALS